VVVGELFVVEAQDVQDGGVAVPDGDGVDHEESNPVRGSKACQAGSRWKTGMLLS
jgi:hypothetical protein